MLEHGHVERAGVLVERWPPADLRGSGGQGTAGGPGAPVPARPSFLAGQITRRKTVVERES